MVTRADLVHALEEVTLPGAKRPRITFAVYKQVWKREEKAATALREYEARFQGNEREMRFLRMKEFFLKKVQQEYPSMDSSLRLRMLYGCTCLLVGSDTIGLSQLQAYLQLYKQDPTQKIEEFPLYWFIGFLGNPDRYNLQEIAELVLELPSVSLPLVEILRLLEEAVLESHSKHGAALFAKILSQPSVQLVDIVLSTGQSKMVHAAIAYLLRKNPNPTYFTAALALQYDNFPWKDCNLKPDDFCSLLLQTNLHSLPEIPMEGCLLAIKKRRVLKRKEPTGSLLKEELLFLKKWLPHFNWATHLFPDMAWIALVEFNNFHEIWPDLERYIVLSLLLDQGSQLNVFAFLFSLLRHHPQLVLSQAHQGPLARAFKMNFPSVTLEMVAVCLHHLPRLQFMELMEASPWSKSDEPLYIFFDSPRSDSFQAWLNLTLSDELEEGNFKDPQTTWSTFILINTLFGKDYYPRSSEPNDMIGLLANLLEKPVSEGLRTREKYMMARLGLQELTRTFVHLMEGYNLKDIEKNLIEAILIDCLNLDCHQEALSMLNQLAQKGPLPFLQDNEGESLLEPLLKKILPSL